jgi:hypothetical protein
MVRLCTRRQSVGVSNKEMSSKAAARTAAPRFVPAARSRARYAGAAVRLPVRRRTLPFYYTFAERKSLPPELFRMILWHAVRTSRRDTDGVRGQGLGIERSFHMIRRRITSFVLAGSLACSPLMVGCENLPGNEKTQGAVIGGLAGAGAGALIGGSKHRLLGALIGGAAGAGGGYLVGANWDKISGKKKDEAERANERAQREPARAEDARDARTADLNNDGFVTLDEVVAMRKADLSDSEMIDRLERTQQYFELTDEQERYLRDNGVSNRVVLAMRNMNPEEPRQASDRSRGNERIGSEHR